MTVLASEDNENNVMTMTIVVATLTMVGMMVEVVVVVFVGWLLACFMSKQNCCVVQGRMCSDNCTRCQTETEAADETILPIHSILTPGQPVPGLTLSRQATGRVATGVPILSYMV